jgi:hypothetical protein
MFRILQHIIPLRLSVASTPVSQRIPAPTALPRAAGAQRYKHRK